MANVQLRTWEKEDEGRPWDDALEEELRTGWDRYPDRARL